MSEPQNQQGQQGNAEAQQQTLPPLTSEQITQIKGTLINSFVNTYQQFIDSIKSIPLDFSNGQMAMQYFHSAFLCFREGIANMPTQDLRVIPPTSQTPAPVAPPQSPEGAQLKETPPTKEPTA